MRGIERRAFSLIEALVFAVLALSLFAIVIGLVRAARIHDEFTSEKLDIVSQLTMVLEKVRRDACVSDRGVPSEDGKTLRMETRSNGDSQVSGNVEYSWSEKGGSLSRSGERVGSSKLLAFAATGTSSLVTVGLLAGPANPRVWGTKAPSTELVAPILFRKEAVRSRFSEWVPDQAE